MKKIFVRAGHTDTAKGAIGILDEREVNKEYSKLLCDKLKQQGFDVKYWIGEGDKSGNLSKGVQMANEWGADLFISCHANAFDGSATGCEVVEYNSSDLGRKLAEEQAKVLCINNRGSKENKGLYELKNTSMKSIINEICFIDNKKDCEAYKNSKNKAIESIVKTVCKHYGVEYKEDTYNTEDKVYKVQVGAFSKKENAVKLSEELEQKGYSTYIISE